MASFLAKIGWNRPRKSENKKLSFRYVLTQRVIENTKKIQKYHYGIISSQNRLEKAEKDKNKNYRSVPFRSYMTLNRKFQ